ncbi:MAG: TatD family hydrolase [Holosporaceae bacterium]|jgi:TatD DNase family protein|nr:TatD family hydrolase [Holosporaceae bacterium]
MFFADSHCHLTFSRFAGLFPEIAGEKYAVDKIISRAEEAGVKYMLTIGTELSDVSELKSIADKYPNVFRTVGIHPLEARKHYPDRDSAADIIEENCRDPKVVAVGEIGLDYHYETESKKQQEEFFNLQLESAKKFNLPVSIHSRDASADTADILKSHAPLSGVIHCFSGDRSFAKKALDLGFYISSSGDVTYKRATELRESLKYIPTDRLLIETDAPFLAPIPFRGKPNEPAFIVYVAEKIAELLNISAEKVAEFSCRNFFDLFTRADLFRKGSKTD